MLIENDGAPGFLPVESDRAQEDQRRFAGVARLFGEAAALRLRGAHVCVIGIGGVGSWAVEALARNAIGSLTLIDLDHISEGNTNRQIHALGDEYGKAKVVAMAERVRAINPFCNTQVMEEFVDDTNVTELLSGPFDYVIDAIDNVRAKTALIAWCAIRNLPVVTCGGAGGRLDPTRIRVNDLSRTVQDPLLSKVRGNLRRQHGFPRDLKVKFGVDAVFSEEPLRYPEAHTCEDDKGGGDSRAGLQGLHCAGYGSSVCVTATFGMVAAAHVLNRLTA